MILKKIWQTRLDFSLKSYETLVQGIVAAKIGVFPVVEWVRKKPAAGIVIRHDVDRKPGHAVLMAELEHSYGIRTTYYFRCDGNGAFPEAAIRKIAAFGHEVGYHYEDLARCRGNGAKAAEMFARNLATIRKIAPVVTVAMHGSPLSGINNHDVWNYTSLADHGITDAILSLDYKDVSYFTDTGRTWGETTANLRDFPSSGATGDVATTPELRAFLAAHPGARHAIVCHPERWAPGPVDWLSQWGKDQLVNAVKRSLRLYRSLAQPAPRAKKSQL